jgi:hypothetical protein
MSSKYKAVLKALQPITRKRVQSRRSLSQAVLPRQIRESGNPYDVARDHLLTLYKPEVVQDVLSDFSPEQLEALNIYWTNIQKSLATKINPSKSIILKEISKIV